MAGYAGTTGNAIRVVVAGALGKMGVTVTRGIAAQPDLELTGAFDPRADSQELKVETGAGARIVPLAKDMAGLFQQGVDADVLVDFTRPDAAGANGIEALRRGVRPVIGTTGIPAEQLRAMEVLCRERGLGACVVPNFSVGVLALTRASLEAARWLKKAEIIEMHHDEKLDAPSGTAKQLAARLESVLGRSIPIHSVRLPGLVANHEVIFGALGQSLTLRHDTMSRDAFLPGIVAAVRKVMSLQGVMLTSLEEVLE